MIKKIYIVASILLLCAGGAGANEYFDFSTGRLSAGSIARSADVNSIFDAIETGLDKLPTESDLKRGLINYATDSGAADAYVVTLTYTPSSYTDGMEVVFKATNTNTGASTINVNSLGVKSIRRQDGTVLLAGDLPANKIITIRYNSTSGYFEIQGGVSATGSGTMASQNASAVAITGGTISGVTVDATSISINSTAITATPAEVNQLDGVTVGGNSSGDILTTDDTQTISGKSFTQTGAITVTDNSSSSTVNPISFETPSLPVSGTAILYLGLDPETGNQAGSLGFYQAGSGSTSNYVFLGVAGHNPVLKVLGTDVVQFVSNIEVNGEVEGTSLDINGSADVSGTLTVGTADVSGTLTVGTLDAVNADASGTLDIGSSATRRVAPSGEFCANSDGYPVLDSVGYIDLPTSLTESTWESIGPTSSGADNIWTALDSVPTDVDWIELRVVSSASSVSDSANMLRSLSVYARDSGSSASVSDASQIADLKTITSSGGNGANSSVADIKVPVTSRIFEAYWVSGYNSTIQATFYLVGYGLNP